MLLQELGQYLQQRKQASLHDIATRFDLEPEVARGMLDFWIAKGRVRLIRQADTCGGGCSCDAKAQMDTYQWNPQFVRISIEQQ